MKILHTSDWHLGRSLYGRRRFEEFSAFLDWLKIQIEKEQVDALLIAGDIFDTATPGNRAQELYYRFLYDTSQTCCRHVVIIGGNHDSPSFLDAPAPLLKVLNVHMIGAPRINPAEELLELCDSKGNPEALICAVPYLRDRDIRRSEAGESIEDKQNLLMQGIIEHYRQLCALADQRKKELNSEIPLIAMGHLFTAGGKILEQDGVRDLYVGSLAMLSAAHFPSSIDYLALGHLHIPQMVGGMENFRYSGSPIPMGFGEAGQQKSVVLVDFQPTRGLELFDNGPLIRLLEIPCFQPLKYLKGSLEEIEESIDNLIAENSNAWLDIELEELISDEQLREKIDQKIHKSSLEVRRLRNRKLIEMALQSDEGLEELEMLDPGSVFLRCLELQNITQDREELIHCHGEIIRILQEADIRSEEEQPRED